MFTFSSLVSFGLLCASALGQGSQYEQSNESRLDSQLGQEPQSSDLTIADFLQSRPELSVFTSGLQSQNLLSRLADPNTQVTLFAPTNRGLENIPDEIRSQWLSNRNFARETLLLHISNSPFSPQCLSQAQSQGALLPTILSGQPICLSSRRQQSSLESSPCRGMAQGNQMGMGRGFEVGGQTMMGGISQFPQQQTQQFQQPPQSNFGGSNVDQFSIAPGITPQGRLFANNARVLRVIPLRNGVVVELNQPILPLTSQLSQEQGTQSQFSSNLGNFGPQGRASRDADMGYGNQRGFSSCRSMGQDMSRMERRQLMNCLSSFSANIPAPSTTITRNIPVPYAVPRPYPVERPVPVPVERPVMPLVNCIGVPASAGCLGAGFGGQLGGFGGPGLGGQMAGAFTGGNIGCGQNQLGSNIGQGLGC